MKLSTTGAQLIEQFEGFVPHPYRDAVGVWTIGYGSTKGVGPSTPRVTRAQAEARLMREVDATYGAAINALRLPLNQNQFDALVSFVYNVGPGGVSSSTGVGRALRAKRWTDAANALLAWDKVGGRTLTGLSRRRRAERALFLKTDRWEGYPADERRWITEYDQLLSANKGKVRRRVLRITMRKRARAIRRTGHRSNSVTRRLKSLDARS